LTGLRTTIDLSSPVFVEILLVTMFLGMTGKVGGIAVASVASGERWSFALCLGTFGQAKGLMEIVVLAVLLENAIVSSVAFSALTLMAVISTALVMPLSRLLLSYDDKSELRGTAMLGTPAEKAVTPKQL